MVRIPSEYQEVEYIERDVEGAIIVISANNLNIGNCDIYASFTVLSTSGERAYMGGYLAISGGKSWEIYFPNKVWKGTSETISVIDSTITKTGVPGEIHLKMGDANWGLILGMYRYGNYQSRNRIHYCRIENDGDVLLNLIPCYRLSDQEPGMYDTVTNTFFTNSGTGTFLVGNDVSYSNVNLMESRRRILLNTPHIKSLSGNALSFKTDVPFELKECKIHFSPVQEGEGTPSPENVRPITGWDGVEVTVCRDIIVNTEWEQGAIAGATVNYSYGYDRFKQNNVTRIRCVSLIPLDSTRTYKVVWNTDVYEVVTQPYDENGKTVAVESPHGIWQTEAYEFNSLHNVAIAIRKKNQSNITPSEAVNANVKLLSEPQTLTIPFPQTVYGGYVDLVKGEVVETYERFEIGSLNWSKNKDYLFTVGLGRGAISIPSVMADSYLSKPMFFSDTSDYAIGSVNSSSYNNMLFCRNKDYANVSEFKEANVGKYVVVKHSSPNTIPLTNPPSIPRTLRGLNNILTNANGNIDIRFWSH